MWLANIFSNSEPHRVISEQGLSQSKSFSNFGEINLSMFTLWIMLWVSSVGTLQNVILIPISQ